MKCDNGREIGYRNGDGSRGETQQEVRNPTLIRVISPIYEIGKRSGTCTIALHIFPLQCHSPACALLT
jgi:hypothetical protein